MFKNMIDMAGPVADLQEFDSQIKEQEQKKKERIANNTLSQT